MESENYYYDVVLPAMKKEFVKLELRTDERLCRKYMTDGCTNNECRFAHGTDLLEIPKSYVPYSESTEGFIDAKFPETEQGIRMTVSFNQCYPTALTKACIHQKLDTSKIVGRVCQTFYHDGGCKHWVNCHFLHVRYSAALTIAKSLLSKPDEENPLGPVFAHEPHELIPPESFEKTPWTCKTKTVQVWKENESEFVDPENICMTACLALDKPKEFCLNPACTRWRHCQYVHLKREFWNGNKKTIFPRPLYFKKNKKANK
jgi:hypothetical protein